MEEDGEAIPDASPVSALHPAKGDMVAAIEAEMPPFRERMLSKSTNKTVTIPRWLDLLARNAKVNYSHLLQEALKNYLGVADCPTAFKQRSFI